MCLKKTLGMLLMFRLSPLQILNLLRFSSSPRFRFEKKGLPTRAAREKEVEEGGRKILWKFQAQYIILL